MKGCDAVLVTGCSLAVAERINDACRDAGASFFYGECRATVANFFADLRAKLQVRRRERTFKHGGEGRRRG